jgi:pimeloyl-ACP methyl ester carboxylesterase
MRTKEKKNAAERSRSSEALRDKSFRLAIGSLGLAAIMLSGCEGGSDKGPMPDIFRSTTCPSCVYAIYRPASGFDDSRLLYYFHGSGGDERTWAQANQGVNSAWEKRGTKPPIVVAVTFGREWLLFPEIASSRGPSLESFVDRLMPEIEDRIGNRPAQRLLYGFSIGGANAAQLFFRYPRLFERVAIVSPQIYGFPIYAPEKEIAAFARGAVPDRGEGSRVEGIRDWIKYRLLRRDYASGGIRRELALLRRYVPDSESWARADILANMRRAPDGQPRSAYISCGREDENGFFPGANELANRAASKGYAVAFDPLAGGHMTIDEEKIARFLAEGAEGKATTRDTPSGSAQGHPSAP